MGFKKRCRIRFGAGVFSIALTLSYKEFVAKLFDRNQTCDLLTIDNLNPSTRLLDYISPLMNCEIISGVLVSKPTTLSMRLSVQSANDTLLAAIATVTSLASMPITWR